MNNALSGAAPDAGAAPDLGADPFGLWQPAPALSREGLSFDVPEGSKGPDDAPSAVWVLDIGDESLGAETLALRERQVQAIEEGLDAATRRMDDYLAWRSNARNRSLSFDAPALPPAPPPVLEAPELTLAYALGDLDPGGVLAAQVPRGAESFGLSDMLGSVTGMLGFNLGSVQQRLDSFLEGVNRQVFHLVWVDTNLNGGLALRTTIALQGDLTTHCRRGLKPPQVAAHEHSLTLALASRAATMHTVMKVSQTAIRIALAATTPLGVAQVLPLALQFIQSVVMPLVKQASQPAPA